MPCMPCQSFGLACTYNRPVKRRGVRLLLCFKLVYDLTKSNQPPPRSQANAGGSVTQLPRPYTLAAQRASADWEYREIADHQAVLDLAELYYRVVHPILLYFHWPTFSADLHSKRYTQDRSFFATTMAVCATASARLRAGAPLPPSSPTFDRIVIPSSEVFYSACLDSLPILTAGHADFNFMRTEALLGMLCLQYDGLDGCHTHLHRYLAMCSEIGFSNERNWPSNLTEIEVQERRRLFWQQYHFDVYLAVTFGSPVRQRGAQCNVLYPAEVYDDEDITPFGLLPRTGSAVSFIRGWNFVTDLYRILEHVSERMQTRQIHGEDPNCHVSHIVADHNVSTKDRLHKDAILATMQRLFEGLPADLKHARPMSGAVCQDRYGFQGLD
ncbi:hypothetical protein PHISCL_03053 [Aspergillus sclerotialis]|uniref:Xylanolytic transcriptional activator regulatory domain-containing protein n=1 Tax=Aspergillus sclerotialis TaxID=2070753 RepID=A0A3A2ZMZ9_9EURO|nr:hypothetical protein PHISCL_03053 [Aspergillus sclerotialis]